MKNNKFDLLIIGGGPGGYSAAIAAAKEGLSVGIFEAEILGGTCLNVGCIPTKYLLDKAAVIEKVRSLTDKKIFKEAGYYSFRKIQAGKEEVIKKLTTGVEYLLKANKITLIRGNARLFEPGKVKCADVEYEGKDIIIATGSESVQLPVPGVEYTITSTEALALEKVPKNLVIIGGGVIGMELASAFCSYGSKVTVIEVLPELFISEERKVVHHLKKELEKREIRILCKTKAEAVKISESGKYRVEYASVSGEETGTIMADQVIMAAGRKPFLKGIDARALDLRLGEKGEIVTDEYMRTNIPHIYAIGDVTGGYQLAHVAYAEGEAAVAHILGREEAIDFSAVPRCIYTMPAFAAVGITEKEAREQGIETNIGNFAYSGNGMALAEGAEGIVQVLMDKNAQTTLGIQIVGECAPEMIAFATMAVKNKMTLTEWQKIVVAHPSLTEMIKEAACDCFQKSIHGVVK